METITYNLSTLGGFCNNDTDAIHTFLGNYIANATLDLMNLKACLETQNYEDVKNTAHKMKNIISLLEAEPCTSHVNIIMNWEKEHDANFTNKVIEFIENAQNLFEKLKMDHQLR